MTPCPERKQALLLLAAQSLDSRQSETLREHLKSCAGCRSQFEELERLCRDLGEPAARVPSLPPPPQFHERLRRRILQETESSPDLHGLLRLWFTPARLALGAVLILAALAFFLAPRTPDALPPVAVQTNQPPPVRIAAGHEDIANTSTLMAYQRAFVESFENLDALLARNQRRAPNSAATTLHAAIH